MPDVNILVYAHRAEDPAHEFYREWLEELLNGASPFALSVLVASGFVRVVTHPRFQPVATGLEQALAFVDVLAGAPNCRLIGPGPESWKLVSHLCRETGVHGSAVSDVQHAATAIEHGCTLVSRDSDFKRFKASGLHFEWLHPHTS